jgi:transmembrane sensor
MPESLPPNTPPDKPDRAIAEWLRDHRAPGEPDFDVDAAWSRFETRQGGGRRVVVATPLWRRPALVGTAAAVLAAAAIVFAVVRLRPFAMTTSGAEMIQRVAEPGRPQMITLDDGSRITMNGGSTLRYPSRGGDRDVYLDGEALFEITHDPRRAFRVHAAAGIVRDIGTKFTVRAYAAERTVQVAVTEGRVMFAQDVAAGQSLDLAAGDAAELDSTGKVAKLPPAAVERLLGWTTGALIFDNARLSAAAAEIEHHYGVRVLIADSVLARRPVVARFHGEPLTQVLDALALALGAHYDVDGKTYTLRPGRK